MAEVNVRGLRELQQAFALADKASRKELREDLKAVAEPVRRDAESLARSSIRKVGPRWSLMRTGVTRKVVYVAPKQRGVTGRGRQSLRRPAFGTLLMTRAMEPALQRHAADLERRVDDTLGELERKFNRG